MEAIDVLDSENYRFGGKVNEQKLPMRTSLGSDVRKRLSDITNLRQSFSPIKDEKLVPCSTKEYIEQLHKENMTLLRVLAERNKIIELTGAELTKMRINLQKVQQQNWHLAQVNSQMLAELNLGKDRLKATQHELGCKTALVAAKNLELQEKVKKKPCPKSCTEELTQKCDKVQAEAAHNDNEDNKICKPSKRRQSRIQSHGSSTMTEQVAVKEKGEDKRQSARVKSEQHEPTYEKADNKSAPTRSKSEQREPTTEKSESKRLCVRRQSARFSSAQVEPPEDLFEIEDAKFPIAPLLDETMQDSTTEEEKKGKNASSSDTPALRRSSIGRPARRAAVKVQCYKEVPLNVKMRRED